MQTITGLLSEATTELELLSPTPKLDAELLLTHVLQLSRTQLKAWPEKKVTEVELGQFQALVSKRKTGVPIAYLLKTQPFWDIELSVNPSVLIPRPETELLVELALEKFPAGSNTRLLDLGTGSGAIAIAIAKSRPSFQVDAVDVSEEALEVARSNAISNQVKGINFLQSNWFSNNQIQTQYHLIISNPPYIAPSDKHITSGDLRYEPISALVSDENGLKDIRMIIEQAHHYLYHKGILMLEHGFEQGEAVRKLLSRADYYNIKTYRDNLEHERVTMGVFHG